MRITLNLPQAQAALIRSLNLGGITTPPEVDVAVVLDVSGSFEDEHRAGVTNDLLTRLVPWGVTFDRDRQLDLITFSSGARSAHPVGAVTPDNYQGYIAREVIGRVPGWGGATDYSYPIERALQQFGWLAAPDESAAGGLFGRLFGRGRSNAATPQVARRSSLVIFITDGDNHDKPRTRQVLRESQARGDGVYFLFLGVSNQGSRFPFREAIGDEFDNTGFVAIRNLRAFVQQTGDDLNGQLLGPELLRWLGQSSRSA